MGIGNQRRHNISRCLRFFALFTSVRLKMNLIYHSVFRTQKNIVDHLSAAKIKMIMESSAFFKALALKENF